MRVARAHVSCLFKGSTGIRHWMAWRLYSACRVLGVFFLATLWTGRGSPHSPSARPEQWPHTPSLLLLHLSHSSRLLSAPQPPPVSPKVLVASPHDRLFLEPFSHAHSFHHSPSTMEAFQPRSLSGSRPHFHLSPICHPLNVFWHTTAGLKWSLHQPQTRSSSSILLLLKSETWDTAGHPHLPSLHP